MTTITQKKFIITIMILFVSSSVFAFSYPEWNSMGRVVSAKDLVDTLLYLYGRLPGPTTCADGSVVNWNQSTGKYECVSCADNQYLVRQSNSWGCTDALSYGNGCKLRYRIKSGSNISNWGETDWGTVGNGNWVDGPTVYVSGTKPTIEFQVGVLCDSNSTLELGYRYRGNRGPYDINTIPSNSSDRSVRSTAGTWADGDFTYPFSKSCYASGGDGGCAMMLKEMSDGGAIKCDARIKFNNGNWQDGTETGFYSYYGSYTDGYNTACPSGGCHMTMSVKCL